METTTAAGGSGRRGKKNKKGKGGGWPKGVDEAARIRISEILERFRSSNEEGIPHQWSSYFKQSLNSNKLRYFVYICVRL